MAPKDYVARGQAKKKPANGKKKPAPAAASPASAPSTPWGRILITLALVVGFAYFLWTIKDTAPESAEPLPKEIVAEKVKPEEVIPEPPKEEWGYIQELENPEPGKFEEVEPLESNSSGRLYQMQCGSFRLEAQAEQMKARIAFQALESIIRATEGKNGLWYRVVLGPYNTKRAAEADRHKLQRAGFTTCQIWGWN